MSSVLLLVIFTQPLVNLGPTLGLEAKKKGDGTHMTTPPYFHINQARMSLSMILNLFLSSVGTGMT